MVINIIIINYDKMLISMFINGMYKEIRGQRKFVQMFLGLNFFFCISTLLLKEN